MTREEFSRIAGAYLYLDGATGSNLVKAGMPSGVCPEQWILEHPGVMLDLQKRYVAAGTDILYVPTFTANRIKLAEYGLEKQMSSMIRSLTDISREAASGADRPVYLAGDLTMTGELLRPMGKMELEDLIDIYKEQIGFLREAGVDLLVVETMMSLAEARAALIAAKEVCSLPVMATLTFEPDGRTLFGTDAVTAAVTLEKLGACAVGANCSTGPDQMRTLIEKISKAVSIPVIAKPNAGMPGLDADGNTIYDMNADTFAEEMKQLVTAGAGILGGCCGTSPEYIKKLVIATRDMYLPPKAPSTVRYLTSERQTLAFGLDSPFQLVGERINPTGKKKLQAELREGRLDMVLAFAEEQEECGASLLDINVGMSGIDEKEMMLKILDEVTVASNLPLSIDSSHASVIEAALRRYPGRALI